MILPDVNVLLYAIDERSTRHAAARAWLEGRLTGGQLAAFMFYGMSVAGSISSFVRLYADIQEALGATRRIFEIIEAARKSQDTGTRIQLKSTFPWPVVK